MTLSCPNCESENVQTVAMAYGNNSSVVYNEKNRAVGVQQTAMGASLAPPMPRKMVWRWAIVVIFAFSTLSSLKQVVFHPVAIIGTLVVALLAALGYYFVRQGQRYNREVYAPARARWERQWICHKCGNVFEN